MGHSNLIKTINEKTEGKYNFLGLKSAVFKKKLNKLFLIFLFPDGKVLTDDEKNEVLTIVKTLFPRELEIEVSFKKSFFDEKILIDSISNFVEATFPSLAFFLKDNIKVEIDKAKTKIEIAIDEAAQDFVGTKQLSKSIKLMLEDSFCMRFDVLIKFEPIHVISEEVQLEIEEHFERTPLRIIEISGVMNWIGKEIEGPALYISDMVQPTEGVNLCGKIKFFTTKKILTKTGKERLLVRFSLQDFTGEIPVVMFVPESLFDKALKLVNDTEVIVFGNVEEDDYSHGLSMKAKNLALCSLPKHFEEAFISRKENINYLFVQPEKIVQTEQMNLFSTSSAQTNQFLLDNDVVVFDLETTGLNFLDSEIIEIGAVKLHNGVIVEKFECFVKPSVPIPAEITKINGITDKDVANAFSCEQVLPDFFKFTRNSVLVAYNIDFDFGFINYYGKKFGFNFSENKRLDAYALAAKTIRGLKNYKLKSVATHLGVSLTNAHRAVADATATAEVFVKLADFV